MGALTMMSCVMGGRSVGATREQAALYQCSCDCQRRQRCRGYGAALGRANGCLRRGCGTHMNTDVKFGVESRGRRTVWRMCVVIDEATLEGYLPRFC